MEYDYKARKIVAVISDAVPVGKAMNALGHLAFAAGNRADPSWMGREKYADAEGATIAGISRYPVIALKATEAELQEIEEKARTANLYLGAYPMEMFDTGPDDELAAAVAKSKTKNFVYPALILVGSTDEIKALTGHLKLYK